MKNMISLMLPSIMLHSGITVIIIHMVTVVQSNKSQKWVLAKAGIAREFNKPLRLY